MPAVSVQTREQFADSEARVVTDMSADLLRLMSTIGLLIALAVIALGLMTATLNRLRDFAVLNALRARTHRLAEEKVDVREIAWLERVATHSRVDRDPRGRVLATAYLALVQSDAKPHLPPDTRWSTSTRCPKRSLTVTDPFAVLKPRDASLSAD